MGIFIGEALLGISFGYQMGEELQAPNNRRDIAMRDPRQGQKGIVVPHHHP
jgi:hypothetical protein